MNQDLLKDVTNGIIEVASNLRSKYDSNSIFIWEYSCLRLQWVHKMSVYSRGPFDFIKKVLSAVFNFFIPDSCWTLSNGFLDIFYLDNVHLVKSGKLTLLTFSLMKNFDNVEHNHIQYDKSYKVTVFYNLNKADFPPFSFYTFSKS